MGLARVGQHGKGVVVRSRARGPLLEQKVPLRGTCLPFSNPLPSCWLPTETLQGGAFEIPSKKRFSYGAGRTSSRRRYRGMHFLEGPSVLREQEEACLTGRPTVGELPQDAGGPWGGAQRRWA